MNKLDKTDESIYTLLSLFILMDQNFQAITGNEEILNSEFDEKHSSFHYLVTDTIYEALVFQIMLRACAFLDEWNETFGIKTEEVDRETIFLIKKIAKPASKQIFSWKQLRDYRNEVIAHNHRDRSGNNIYLNFKTYHAPDTPYELYLMLFCIRKMMDIVRFFFFEKMENLIKLKTPTDGWFSKTILSPDEIKKIINNIEISIDNDIAEIISK